MNPSAEASGLTLAVSDVYYACVRTVDGADAAGDGNVSSNATCSDGQEVIDVAPDDVADVRDGGVDVDESGTASAQLTANWDEVAPGPGQAKVRRYEACFTESASGADCGTTALTPWEAAGGTAHSAAPAVSDDDVIFACVRVVDDAGQTSGGQCSDGMEVDDVAPGLPGAITDGSGTDVDWMAADGDLEGSWGAAVDDVGGTGVSHYEVCVALDDAATDCDADSAEVPVYVSMGTTVTVADLGFAPGTQYFLCVRTVDQAQNTSDFNCSDGFIATGATIDGDIADPEWATSSSVVEGLWSARLDPSDAATIATYEYCVSEDDAGGDCGTTWPWSTSGVTGDATGLTLATATPYYFCARSFESGEPNPTATACSRPFYVDTTPPTVPTSVTDSYDGADVDTYSLEETPGLSWEASSDGDSGVLAYEVCTSDVTPCSGEWVDVAEVGSSVVRTETTVNEVWYSCVRAVDAAGLRSTEACTDGFEVSPTSEDLEYIGSLRLAYGLDGSTATASARLEDEDTNWDLGAPLTDAEYQDVSDDLDAQSEAVEEVEAYGAANSAHYGGVWVDGANNEVHAVVVGSPTEVSTHTQGLESAVSEPALLEVDEGDHTLDELESNADRLLGDGDGLEARLIPVASVGIDIEHNGLELGLPEGNQTTTVEGVDVETLINASAEYEPPVTVVEDDPEESVPVTSPANRDSYGARRGTWAPGTIYFAARQTPTFKQQTCTTGVHVRKGSRYYMLTAAHCAWAAEYYGTGACRYFNCNPNGRKYVNARKIGTRRGGWSSILDVGLIRIPAARASGTHYAFTSWDPAEEDYVDRGFYFADNFVSAAQGQRVCHLGAWASEVSRKRTKLQCGSAGPIRKQRHFNAGNGFRTRLITAKHRVVYGGFTCSGDSGAGAFRVDGGSRRVAGVVSATWIRSTPFKNPWRRKSGEQVHSCSYLRDTGRDLDGDGFDDHRHMWLYSGVRNYANNRGITEVVCASSSPWC